MRLIGSFLFCAAFSALFAEQTEQNTTAATSGKLSSRLAGEIRAALPKYQPHPVKSEPENPVTPGDTDVLILPKVVVRQSAPARIADYDLLTEKALDKKLVHEYKNSLEGLDSILNGFSVPLFAPSMKARARGAYKERKLDDLNTFIKATGAADHQSGAELKKAADDLKRADEWTHRLVK